MGQTFVSKAMCRETVEKYAVKEKVNIQFQRSERKKVAVVCVVENCQWRLYASINSRSENMVVRSYIGNHSCYPSGVVKLYTLFLFFHLNSAKILVEQSQFLYSFSCKLG